MAESKVLLNASNLHVGGGVQVATSVIGEMTMMPSLPAQLTIWASSEVDRNLKSLNYDLSIFPNYEVIDMYGINALSKKNRKKLSIFDKVFTIFGPLYSISHDFYSIVGFAQPWIIYPNNEVYSYLRFLDKIRYKLKFKIQKYFFSKADELVVELEHVAKGIVNFKIN